MKLALVSSLAYRPRLLVLDEPFSGLDPVMREDLIGGVIDSACETTVLISSHDLADLETFASHIGYLANGRLKFSEEVTSLTARSLDTAHRHFGPDPC
jgi:ABC-2 type transport system ATP-binding protein